MWSTKQMKGEVKDEICDRGKESVCMREERTTSCVSEEQLQDLKPHVKPAEDLIIKFLEKWDAHFKRRISANIDILHCVEQMTTQKKKIMIILIITAIFTALI